MSKENRPRCCQCRKRAGALIEVEAGEGPRPLCNGHLQDDLAANAVIFRLTVLAGGSVHFQPPPQPLMWGLSSVGGTP